MYCPKCEYEYPGAVMICPDCNVALLEKRPAKINAAVSPDNSWVQVVGVRSNTRAEMAKGALDSNNIPSVLTSSTFTALARKPEKTDPEATLSIETNVIMVPREFLEEAEFVIQAVLGDDAIPLDAK